MRNRLRGPSLVLIAVACLGCAGAATPAAYSQTRAAGRHEATLTIDPYPPLTMQKVHLRLDLRNETGQPVCGARVRYDLDMPYCTEMPLNRPEATEAEPGVYVTPAVLTMAGYWKATVAVEGAGVDEELEFFFQVR